MSWDGVILGGTTVAIIALSRWGCIKGEYYFGKNLWVAFLFLGACCIIAALWVEHRMVSAILSITGFCLLWGIGEIIQQEKRVAKGWFPANPRHKHAAQKQIKTL